MSPPSRRPAPAGEPAAFEWELKQAAWCPRRLGSLTGDRAGARGLIRGRLWPGIEKAGGGMGGAAWSRQRAGCPTPAVDSSGCCAAGMQAGSSIDFLDAMDEEGGPVEPAGAAPAAAPDAQARGGGPRCRTARPAARPANRHRPPPPPPPPLVAWDVLTAHRHALCPPLAPAGICWRSRWRCGSGLGGNKRAGGAEGMGAGAGRRGESLLLGGTPRGRQGPTPHSCHCR